MDEQKFLILLNNLVICREYNALYFENIFKLIKEFCDADEVVTDNFKRKGDPVVKLNLDVNNKDMVFDIGVVNTKIVVKNPKREFEDKEMFEIFLTTILENIFKNYLMVEKLKQEKNMDSLLQTYNRSAYEEILNKNNIHRMCGVAFIDANGLGVVNNMYGHEAGDKLLKTIGESLKKYFRYYDIYRIGGDELVVICENINKELFFNKLDMFRMTIGETPYDVSIGAIYEEEINDLKMVVNEANVLMKKEKEEFRKLHPEKYINKYEVHYVGDIEKSK